MTGFNLKDILVNDLILLHCGEEADILESAPSCAEGFGLFEPSNYDHIARAIPGLNVLLTIPDDGVQDESYAHRLASVKYEDWRTFIMQAGNSIRGW